MGGQDTDSISSFPPGCNLQQTTIMDSNDSSAPTVNSLLNANNNISNMDAPYTTAFTFSAIIKQPCFLVVLFIVAYSIIFVAALVGNTMVVAVVILRPGMRSVTNLFIANLAVADMLVAIFCIPMTLMDNIYYGWPFGGILCRLTPYVQGVSVCASVYILAAIAVDRYLAICFRPQCRIMRRGAVLTLVGIWIFSLALVVPWLVYYRHFQNSMHEFCLPQFPSLPAQKAYYFVAIFLGTYIVPLLIVFLCYTLIARRVWQRRAPGVAIGCDIIKRYKIKVIKMLITVVTVFALFWLPLHTLYILMFFDFSEHIIVHITNIGIPIAQWLELSNSGVNPFIYCFFSENFRSGFADLFRCVLRRRRATHYRGGSSLAIPRRVGRSFSEESTMMGGSSVIQRPQFSSRTRQNGPFLYMSPMEKRYAWRNGCRHAGSAQSMECKSNNSILKQTTVKGIEMSRSRNSSNALSIVEINNCVGNSNKKDVYAC